MVTRPESIPDTRKAWRMALQELNGSGEFTPCAEKPVPYSEVRQSPDEAAALCGRNLPEGDPGRCKLLEMCTQLGFTESVYADDMVYGGYAWRKGLPLVSETAFEKKRATEELKKLRLPTNLTALAT